MLLLRVNIVSGTADDGNKFLLLWPQVSPYGDESLLKAWLELFASCFSCNYLKKYVYVMSRFDLQ